VSTQDDEYQFQVHNLTQIEFRVHQQGGQDPVRDTFAIPRSGSSLSGRLTKPYEYFVATSFGFDSFNVLDCFLNVHYDDRIQLKLGRYKTPFTYEFYALPING
jgi:phosphate-selective porin OprO/OprP